MQPTPSVQSGAARLIAAHVLQVWAFVSHYGASTGQGTQALVSGAQTGLSGFAASQLVH